MGVERMGDHFCPNCGTEVEADARFCPTCGTTLSGQPDAPRAEAGRSDQPELPPAPAWPPPEPATEPGGSDEAAEPMQSPEPEPQPPTDSSPVTEQLSAPERGPEPTAEEPPPAAAGPPPAAGTPPPAAPPPPQPAPAGSMELPFTWPTMLSGWLIGGGSLLGAIFLIATLGNVVSLLLFLALLAIAASVFLADRVPDIPRQRLIILATSMIGLGVGLGRAGFTFQGADTLFLVAMLAAAGGALLIELDRDRPMPPPERPA